MDDEPTLHPWGPSTGQPAPPPVDPTTSWHGVAPLPPPTLGPAPAPSPEGAPASQPPGVGKYVIGAIGALLVVGVLAGAYLLGRSGGDDPADPTTTTTSVAPTPEPAPTPPPTTSSEPTTTAAPPPAAPGSVLAEPAGLFCRDLRGRGYSYSAAVAYYEAHGHTDQMDADKNGIPCETVYPRSDIVAYWPQSTYDVVPSYTLPSGLLCRDLQARGIGVYDALRYYVWEGSPDRMDADGNGIPCETVYSNATIVWLTEF